MKFLLLLPAGTGLCLIAGILFGSSPSQAQSTCYMTDATGQGINLDHLCQSSSTSTLPLAQSDVSDEADFADVGMSTESNSDNVSRVIRYTVVGPVVVENPSANLSSPESSSVEPLVTNTRRTRVQILQTPDVTITVIDRPDREVNGIVIEGRDRIIIGPGTSEHPHEDAAYSASVEE
ncbi:MAG: hypothetical protein F6K42_28540 [Leptolyngbya sp. SIO1D8]|nr:hypothetical protein [Leptolyngbya sp. SIO1D8]